MVRKVRELNKENFAVRQHLKYVELYADPNNYMVGSDSTKSNFVDGAGTRPR